MRVCRGLFLAPALACAFVVVDRQAPAGTVTEAFSWLVTTFGVGAAAGTAVVGPVIEWGSPSAGFAVAGVSGVAGLLVLLGTRRVLAAPARSSQWAANPVTSEENDRNGQGEPSFRSRSQA